MEKTSALKTDDNIVSDRNDAVEPLSPMELEMIAGGAGVLNFD